MALSQEPLNTDPPTAGTDNAATTLNESGSTPQFDLIAKDKFAASGTALANIAGGFGAGTRIRTTDPLITNEMLYQLSYTGSGREV